MSARAGLDLKAYLDDDNGAFTHYKGGLAEQFVFQELIAANDRMPIYYWATDKNTAEIEFVLQLNNEIIPLEVKSGKNVKSESLKLYRSEFHPKHAVRASLKKYGAADSLHSVPLYMIGSLAKILS